MAARPRAEVLELIEKIQATAREKRGIELETEVQIVGGTGDEKICREHIAVLDGRARLRA